MSRITAIIPARGGSKGIYRKNLIRICGKPLIVWSIESALRANLIDRVVVSSDDADIRAVAQKYGATACNRTPQSATDKASSELALIETIGRVHAENDIIVFLQATSPVRLSQDLDYALCTFHDLQADSLFSAREIHGYTWTLGEALTPNYYQRARRQDLKTRRLEENGNFYIFHPQLLFRTGRRLGGKVVPYIQHPLDGYQIDTPEDVMLIESILPLRLGQIHDCSVCV